MANLEPSPTADILYKLIFDYEYREAFCNKKFDELGLTDEEINLLSTIDTAELTSMSDKIVKDLLYMNAGYGGELYYSFQKTFNFIKNPEDLIKQFLKSNYFRNHHIIQYNEVGFTLQEAFYNFLSSLNMPSVANWLEVIKHDFLSSLFKVLVVNHNPSFRVENTEVEFCAGKIYSVQQYTGDFLVALGVPETNSSFIYIVANKKLIMGPVPKEIAELIKAKISDKFFSTNPKTMSIFRRLVDLGIIRDQL